MDDAKNQPGGVQPDAAGAGDSSQVTDPAPASGAGSTAPPEETPLALPSWVAPAIALLLVAIAAMAVWTGFRPRARSDSKYVLTEQPMPTGTLVMPEDSGGAPGDPGPGASFVVQSETGGAVPEAAPLPPEGEQPRPGIRGDAGGVVPTTSLEVRRGIAFECDRPEATVFVNDLPMGEAAQYGSLKQPYEFSEEGSFDVRVVAKDGTEARFRVVASAGAQIDVEVIRVRLATP